MKIAKEIDQLLATNGLYPVDRIGIAAPLISAKLEPIVEILKEARNAESARDMWEDVGSALALFEEE